MKIKKIFDLIDKGLTAKTLSKLSESQIEVLHSRIIGESRKEAKEEIKKTVTNVTYDPANEADKQKLAQMGVHVGADKKITMSQAGGAITTETEMSEEDDFDMDADQAYTGQQGSHDEYQAADDGMDDDTSPENKDRKMVGMSEGKKKSKKDDDNPWAICTAQLGKEFGTRERSLWSAKENNKYERCVKDVKKSLKEGKNPLSLFLENEIEKIVERNLPPKITKKELMNYLNEAEPAVAPTKPAPTTKPGTKPTPTKRPGHPGKNPNPGVNPKPKAKRPSPDEAKDKLMDVIMQILQK